MYMLLSFSKGLFQNRLDICEVEVFEEKFGNEWMVAKLKLKDNLNRQLDDILGPRGRK